MLSEEFHTGCDPAIFPPWPTRTEATKRIAVFRYTWWLPVWMRTYIALWLGIAQASRTKRAWTWITIAGALRVTRYRRGRVIGSAWSTRRRPTSHNGEQSQRWTVLAGMERGYPLHPWYVDTDENAVASLDAGYLIHNLGPVF